MSEQFARVDAAVSTNGRLVRFGTFELDPCSGELKRNGRRVPLQDQPARALCLLASRPRQLVTRDELRQALWSADTFLEFDTALNIVVTKVRHALGDVAASPRFIETVPKRGYRFIADVRQATETVPATKSDAETELARPLFAEGIARSIDAGAQRLSRARLTRWLAGTLLLAGVSVAASRFWRPDRMTQPAEPPVMQLEVNLGPGVSLRTGPGPSIAISPNGKRLVFVSDGRLMMRRLDQRDSMALGGTDGLTSFFFSPDGESVAFVAHGKLRRLALDGTSVVTMTDAPEGRGGSWAEDGAIVLAGISGGLMRDRSRGSNPTSLRIVGRSSCRGDMPSFSPATRRRRGGAAVGSKRCRSRTAGGSSFRTASTSAGSSPMQTAMAT
jgi:DNA-binding winged helix-turn-helix (wHTH) protein